MISFFNVTSAGQLAGLQLMAAGAGLAEMALTQLTINLRYALMSLSLSQKLDSSMTLPHRLLLSFCNTDEVFVVASQQPGKVGPVSYTHLDVYKRQGILSLSSSPSPSELSSSL